jgi:hypothetical protein
MNFHVQPIAFHHNLGMQEDSWPSLTPTKVSYEIASMDLVDIR